MEIKSIEESGVIEDYPDYKVDKTGNVVRISDGYKMPWLYPKVQLKDKEGNLKTINVHSLVAKKFIEKPVSKEELIIGHKDDDKQNPNADNLHWITRSQNNIDAYKNNRQRIDDGYRANCKPVVAKHYKSEAVLGFGGIRLAARELGLQSISVTRCCNGKYSNSGGWQFMYEEDYLKVLKFPNIIIKFKGNKKQVRQLDLEGNYIKTFESAVKAAKATGASVAKISLVANGNRKTTGGYKWEFVKP